MCAVAKPASSIARSSASASVAALNSPVERRPARVTGVRRREPVVLALERRQNELLEVRQDVR